MGQCVDFDPQTPFTLPLIRDGLSRSGTGIGFEGAVVRKEGIRKLAGPVTVFVGKQPEVNLTGCRQRVQRSPEH